MNEPVTIGSQKWYWKETKMERIIYSDRKELIIGTKYKMTAENGILYIYIRRDNGIIAKRPYAKYKIEVVKWRKEK